MRELIIEQMQAGIDLRQTCLESLQTPLMQAASQMVHCLQSGGKVLACGNGGSASDAMHFVAELVNRFEVNRPALAAIALVNDASVMTSIANDFEFNAVFSRQIEALGRKDDVLLGISTSGNSQNVRRAMQTANSLGMQTIALTGHDGGVMAKEEGLSTSIHIPCASTARVQEMHITCLHILCAIIDRQMFGK
ncbi:MAG: SIS domain-containing protein [Mariprofundaceae bacterium]|nr:SIS domain-containing protein [Mariprofundaceae bacterium]